MTFKEWAKDYFDKFPASEDTRREYTAAKAAWGAAHSVEPVTSAPEVAKLVEALEEMIDVAHAVDSWESFPSDPIERAEDAIRDYRKQGGDS